MTSFSSRIVQSFQIQRCQDNCLSLFLNKMMAKCPPIYSIGGSRGGVPGARHSLRYPILSFSHTFSPKSARVWVNIPPNGSTAPYGKSWIRNCIGLFNFLRYPSWFSVICKRLSILPLLFLNAEVIENCHPETKCHLIAGTNKYIVSVCTKAWEGIISRNSDQICLN